jgi:winged helix DNA-binding protein
MSWSEVWHRRVSAHCLSTPAPKDRLVEVVGRMCGVHAQVAASAELSLAVRLADLRQVDVRRALWSERSLVKTYGIRGTLHLFPTHELGVWLAALRSTPPPRPNPVRDKALPPDRLDLVVDGIRQALDGRQLTREELEAALVERLGGWVTDAALPAFGGRWPCWQLALGPAALRGVLAFGPNRGNRVTYVRLDQWTGEPAEVDGAVARREVCRRYLAAYGPVTPAELARWLYTTPAAASELIDSLGDEVEQVDVEGWRAAAVRSSRGSASATQPNVRLLPQFDSYVVGCHPRQRLIPDTAPAALKRGTGAPFAVLLVDGVVAGLWQRERRGSRLTLRVDPFVPLGRAQQRELAPQAQRIAEFLGVSAELEQGSVEPRAHL